MTPYALVFALLIALATLAEATPLELQVDIMPERASVDAQLVYRMRFFHAVDVQDVVFRPPVGRLAEVRPLGQTRRYEETRQGRRYRVHEARYAISASASGPLVLDGAEVGGYRPGWGRVRFRAPARAIDIAPARVLQHGVSHWIPAQSLSLSEVAVTAPGRDWLLGETRGRKLVIEAVGVDPSILPELTVLTDGFSVSPGQVRLSSEVRGGMFVARREQDFMLTPRRPGWLSLSDVRLTWWSETQSRWALSVLPGRGVFIAPRPDPAITHGVVNVPAGETIELVVGIGAVLLLGGGVMLTRRRVAYYGRLVLARWRVARACADDDPEVLQKALLEWGGACWPGSRPSGLAELAEKVADDRFSGEVYHLQQRLYGPKMEGECRNFAASPIALPWRSLRVSLSNKESSHG